MEYQKYDTVEILTGFYIGMSGIVRKVFKNKKVKVWISRKTQINFYPHEIKKI